MSRSPLAAAWALSVVVLAGCGAGGAAGEDSGDASTATGTRTVQHALGTTEVPERPERVATLSEAVAGHLASVGLLVTAAPDDVPEWLTPYRETFAPDLDLASITLVGTSDEPNLEALAAAAPDLIVIEEYSEEFFDELSGIAPTVVVTRPSNADWQQGFAQTVELVGRDAEAVELRERYAEALAAVPPGAADIEVSCARANEDGSFRIDGPRAFCGSVAAEAGFAVTAGPADVAPNESGYIEVSGERMAELTGELIVAQTDSPAVETIEGLSGNPLWSQLPAVQARNVVTLPNPVYNNGTYYAATLLLETMTRAAP